ncbi:hypothetical protein H8R94_08600 [Roseburia sp. NSJ-9]|uniref:Uncharacterized protein n=1 Tax=Roseburia lenta TaxID=2763061 RepID=A0ABR7GGS9_9FIRM|nr:hypothetical protein [Roseburia lenta]MBC5686654.1 hypothetical protein [Roseburia lenta]
MEKTIYIKFSEDRAPEFCSKTRIAIADGNKVIYKSDPNGQISEHLALMPEKHQWLVERYGDTAIDINDVKRTDKGMQFAFVSGESIQSKLDLYILQGNEKKVRQLLNEYVERLLRHGSYRGDFQPNADEQKIFGNVEMRDIDLAKVSNIDMIFPNVLVDEEKWHVIDYEWTFDFEIPQKFILYRALLYWNSTSNALKNHTWEEVLDLGEISLIEAEIFEKMEACFQRYVAGETETFRTKANYECKPQFSINQINQKIIRTKIKKEPLKVYYPTEKGYDEENTCTFYWERRDDQAIKIDIKEAYDKLRLDPIEQSCMIRIDKVSLNGEPLSYSYNGVEMSENVIGFDHNDPQIIVDLEGKKGTFCVRYEIMYADDFEWLNEVVSYERALREEKQRYIEKIEREAQSTILEQQEIINAKTTMIDQFMPTVWYKAYHLTRLIKNYLNRKMGD